MRSSHSYNVLTAMLHYLHVNYTDEYADHLYNEHPYKYNMYGLSMMLSTYKVENAGIRLDDKSQIAQVPLPFIAHMGDDFVTVCKIANNKIYYIGDNKKVVEEIDAFNTMWTGAALLAKNANQASEPFYSENLKKSIYKQWVKWLCAILTIGLVIYASRKYFNSIIITSILLFNLVGIYVGYLLLLKQLHYQSRYVDKICSLLKKGNCSDILESSASKFLGIISWSEIGFCYFLSNILTILCCPTLIPYYALVNILTLFYSAWSVWYQKFRAKQWCALCLCIQLIFWLLFSGNLWMDWIRTPSFSLTEISVVIMLYLLPYLIIEMLIPRFEADKQIVNVHQSLNNIKVKNKVFKTLLQEQACHEVSKTNSHIIFGDPQSEILLTVLTNPHCEPCAIMHQRLFKLLDELKNKISIQFIFSAFDDSMEISNRFLIAVYQQKTIFETIEIYNEWYAGGKNNKNYMEIHPVNLETPEVFVELNRHNEWRNKNKLSATPIVLFNGYEMPKLYRVEDIFFLQI